ncbi:DNA polymerase theta-like [Dorcoceras hygrometricum]|uniref:DNA polymerase theta-like n=1 Tax=Dorcoceras hygrometricum TaxID=472368 RepID=A0A2Z7CAI6_9LAMI|nr:DNA polymerase theta-like [Dorcoceras hygrometricum]
MAESSRLDGGKGKSVVPPTRNVSPLNIQDLDFLFDDEKSSCVAQGEDFCRN